MVNVIKKIDGKRYLMRDKRPLAELRKLHADFCTKYKSKLSLHDWLVQRGKVYSVLDNLTQSPK